MQQGEVATRARMCVCVRANVMAHNPLQSTNHEIFVRPIRRRTQLQQIDQVASVDGFGSTFVQAKLHPEGKAELSPQRELCERKGARASGAPKLVIKN